MSEQRPPTPMATPAEGDRSLAPVYDAALQTLRIGWKTGAVLLLIGLAMSLYQREDLLTFVHPMEEIPGNAVDGAPHAFVDLAFIVIMTTPVVTVLRVGLGFYRVGERRFAIYSLGVLLILALSILLSLVRR